MKSHFLAYMSRMKHIVRWGLMRNTRSENDQEHSHQVAMIAHMLAVMTNARHGGSLDVGRVVTLAVYHEAPEVITGDLATPIKYFNPDIRCAFKEIERLAARRLQGYLPEDLRERFEELLFPDENSEEWKLVKAADRLSAYLKCMEELSAGNGEFQKAAQSILKDIRAMKQPAVAEFMEEFAPSFSLTLDELN